MSLKYLKVSSDVVANYGCEAAVLLSLIQTTMRILPKDQNGYCRIDSIYLMRGASLKRNKFLRVRQCLVDAGLLEVVHGNNQNAKPRYRLKRL
ncbi:hypothetical protein IKD67_01690 [Candidatus Saccharibacteria bacterium]|nr:hypothetical protein [Candidatus Saccharibacteria bacterium]